MNSLSCKPKPKPRTSLNNKEFINENLTETCNSKFDLLFLNKSITSNASFEKQQLSPLNSLPSCPVDYSHNLLINSDPPPLPPRNVNSNLQSLISLNNFIEIQKPHINSIIQNKNYDIIEKFDSIALNNFYNANSNAIDKNYCKSSPSSEFSIDKAHCSFESIDKLSSNYCDSIIYTANNNNNNKNLNNINKESIKNDYKQIDDIFCFSGWVHLITLPQSYNNKKNLEKRYWATIRSNQLIFSKDDEVFNLILSTN